MLIEPLRGRCGLVFPVFRKLIRIGKIPSCSCCLGLPWFAKIDGALPLFARTSSSRRRRRRKTLRCSWWRLRSSYKLLNGEETKVESDINTYWCLRATLTYPLSMKRRNDPWEPTSGQGYGYWQSHMRIT